MSDWMACGRCGDGCVESDADGLFFDGQEGTCPDCGAVNVVHADEDGDVWVRWTCKHGADDETPCSACDAEDDGPVTPGGKEGT